MYCILNFMSFNSPRCICRHLRKCKISKNANIIFYWRLLNERKKWRNWDFSIEQAEKKLLSGDFDRSVNDAVEWRGGRGNCAKLTQQPRINTHYNFIYCPTLLLDQEIVFWIKSGFCVHTHSFFHLSKLYG